MIQCILSTAGQVEIGGEELIERWQQDGNSWLWVDLYQYPSEQEYDLLVNRFELDAGAVEEAQRDRHPPSFEAFNDYIYLLLKPLDAQSDSLDFSTLQLAMFAGEHLLITRHSKPSPYLQKLQERVRNNPGEDTPLSIMTAMGHRVADRYGRVLLDLEQRLDVIEDELFETSGDQLMKELVGYNTGLRKMSRILNYYVDVYDQLRRKLHKSGNEYADNFDDIFAVTERFASLSNLYQNVINDLIEAYISLNGHHLNQIMKVLTIVTVIFVPLTLLVGIYGMNFENMPELKSHYGYFILLSIMGAIAFILLYLFRKVRWL
jgi:magnesium transporter